MSGLGSTICGLRSRLPGITVELVARRNRPSKAAMTWSRRSACTEGALGSPVTGDTARASRLRRRGTRWNRRQSRAIALSWACSRAGAPASRSTSISRSSRLRAAAAARSSVRRPVPRWPWTTTVRSSYRPFRRAVTSTGRQSGSASMPRPAIPSDPASGGTTVAIRNSSGSVLRSPCAIAAIRRATFQVLR